MSPLFYEKVLITSFDEQLVQLFSVLHSVFKHQQPKFFFTETEITNKIHKISMLYFGTVEVAQKVF